jgi:hypothetical protein
MSTTQLPPLNVASKELDALLDHIYEHTTVSEGIAPRALALCKAYALAALASVEGEPKWGGAAEWEPLAWALCAEEHGEEACNELIWDGGPIPEPWGDRWMKYEGEAKRMIALVREHVRPQPAQANTEPDQRGVTHITWDEHGRRLVDGQLGGEHQADAAQGGRVAAGWKLVPVEPTQDMKWAAVVLADRAWCYHVGRDDAAKLWASMLAASPEPAAASQEQAQQPAQAEAGAVGEREAFETWLRSVWTPGYGCPKSVDGKYTHGEAQRFWECWQARAALQSAGQVVDAERWQTALLISHEVLRPPALRKHQHVLDAYYTACASGQSYEAAIDAAIRAGLANNQGGSHG